MKLSKKTIELLEKYRNTSKEYISQEETICKLLDQALEPTLEDKIIKLKDQVRDLEDKIDRIDQDLQDHIYGY